MALSSGPGVQLPSSWLDDLLAVDKVGHAFFYGVQTMLLLWALRAGSRSKWILAIVISILFGAAMEWMQYQFYPNRFFELLDLLANIIGSLIGAYIYKRFFTTK